MFLPNVMTSLCCGPFALHDPNELLRCYSHLPYLTSLVVRRKFYAAPLKL